LSALTISSGELLAEEAPRTISGLLVPFGERCRSNLGEFTVEPGVLELPVDVPGTVGLNDGHARNKPIGRGIVLAEQADGIHGTFQVAKGAEGDQALADVATGVRKFLSVEADVVVEAGKALSGRIFGAALVSPGKRGAFPSAMLLATAADDAVVNPDDPTTAHFTTMTTDPVTGEVFETETTVDETEETDPDTGATVQTRTTTEVTTITPGTPAEGGAPVPVPTAAADPLLAEQPAARVPAALLGRRPARQAAPATVSKGQLFAMLAKAAPTHRGAGWDSAMLEQLRSPRVVGTLYAELDDVTFDAAGSPNDMVVPQWIGELWSGRSYQRRWAPLFGAASLTSPTVKGWRWKTRPVVGKWEANKTDVPSGPVETEPYDVEAQPFAGAHDVDRRYRDFNVTEFWDGYFTAMTESYAKQSDLYVPDELFAPANAALTAVTGGDVPTGVSAVLAKIVDGALAILDEDLPSFAAVSLADWRSLMLTREQDNLAFLNAALGLEEGTIGAFRVIPTSHAGLNGGKVLVGSRSAATVHELPGSPIRIEGLDVARGGIDPGLYGYTALAIHNPKALALVSPGA
jgi:hypothetical protein